MVNTTNVVIRGNRFIAQRYIGHAHRFAALLRADAKLNNLKVMSRAQDFGDCYLYAYLNHGECMVILTTEYGEKKSKKKVEKQVSKAGIFLIKSFLTEGKGTELTWVLVGKEKQESKIAELMQQERRFAVSADLLIWEYDKTKDYTPYLNSLLTNSWNRLPVYKYFVCSETTPIPYVKEDEDELSSYTPLEEEISTPIRYVRGDDIFYCDSKLASGTHICLDKQALPSENGVFQYAYGEQKNQTPTIYTCGVKETKLFLTTEGLTAVVKEATKSISYSTVVGKLENVPPLPEQVDAITANTNCIISASPRKVKVQTWESGSTLPDQRKKYALSFNIRISKRIGEYKYISKIIPDISNGNTSNAKYCYPSSTGVFFVADNILPDISLATIDENWATPNEGGYWSVTPRGNATTRLVHNTWVYVDYPFKQGAYSSNAKITVNHPVNCGDFEIGYLNQHYISTSQNFGFILPYCTTWTQQTTGYCSALSGYLVKTSKNESTDVGNYHWTDW